MTKLTKKPLGIKNYGSIPHLSNSNLGRADRFIEFGQEVILTKKVRDKHDVVLVFEKYDGSNVGVAKKDGNIFAITRSGYEASMSPYVQHHEFSRWVAKEFKLFNAILSEGERVTGEWLLQTHSIKYEIRQQPIVFYDFFNAFNYRKSFENLRQTGLPLARLLHRGDAVSVESLLPELNKGTPTILSKDNPEGMVYRVERRGVPDFLAKWVRSDFEAGKYMKQNLRNTIK